MSIRNGWPAVSGAADQYDIRAALRATIAQDATGRIKTGAAATSTSLTMLVTARQDMAVDLQPSDWVLDRRGPVCLSVDGVETIPLAPAPSANSRVDTVWIMQRETQAPIGDNADGPLAGITTGVPGISPVAPALTDGQLAVADILIPSTATNTSSDGVVITQRAPYTTMQGGLLRFRSPTDLNLWKPVDGQRARLQDGTEYVGSGGVWVSQTHAYWQGKARRSDGQLAVNNGTTNLKITADKDGGLPVQLQGDAAGTRISGLQGDHLVSLHLPVGGGQSWTGVEYQLRGNPIVMLGNERELAKPSGFGSLDLTSVIRFTTSSDGIVIVLNSNPDVPMRSDMTISIMKL